MKAAKKHLKKANKKTFKKPNSTSILTLSNLKVFKKLNAKI